MVNHPSGSRQQSSRVAIIIIIIIIKDIYIAQVRKGHKCAIGRDGSLSMVT